MTLDEVERSLTLAREVLVDLAERVAIGEESRGELFEFARVEADDLLSLLDEAPESEHEKIHLLLDRYDSLLAAVVN